MVTILLWVIGLPIGLMAMLLALSAIEGRLFEPGTAGTRPSEPSVERKRRTPTTALSLRVP